MVKFLVKRLVINEKASCESIWLIGDVSPKSLGNKQMAEMERKFIKKYKQLSYLWNPNHPDYNNRFKRNEGYDILLPIFREYMPNATRFHIRQKINILRSCYRKELRKHMASRSLDPDGKLVYSYKPQSWKFQMLRFLDCDEDGENDTSETYRDFEEEQELEFIQDHDHDQDIDAESGNEDNESSKINISPLLVEDEKPRVRKRLWHNSCSGDEDVLEREFNAIGTNVACKLQRMDAQQRYHAELLINKVLINGLNRRLTVDTDLTENWRNNHVSNYSIIEANLKHDPKDIKPDS